MNHFGFSLHPETNDLHLAASGELEVARGAKAVGEHIRQRLMTYTGEWFLDTTAGVPWLDQLMGRAYDPALAEAVVKAEILDTDGVVEILSFSVGFDRDRRQLLIREIEVLTIYDETVRVAI